MNKFQQNLSAKIIDLIAEKDLQLYACHWNPNGTNDVLIVNSGEIFDAICELTFGLETATCDDQLAVHPYQNHVQSYTDIKNDPDGAEIAEQMTFVREFSAKTIIENIAVSPTSSTTDQLEKLWDCVNRNFQRKTGQI